MDTIGVPQGGWGGCAVGFTSGVCACACMSLWLILGPAIHWMCDLGWLLGFLALSSSTCRLEVAGPHEWTTWPTCAGFWCVCSIARSGQMTPPLACAVLSLGWTVPCPPGPLGPVLCGKA